MVTLKLTYTDIKTIGLVKKQTLFQRKMENFKGNTKTKNVCT